MLNIRDTVNNLTTQCALKPHLIEKWQPPKGWIQTPIFHTLGDYATKTRKLTTKCKWIVTIQFVVCQMLPFWQETPNHRHPVSPLLAPTRKNKQHRTTTSCSFPLSLSVYQHCFPSSKLKLLPNLTGPLKPPRTGLTSPTHVSYQLWPLEEQAGGKEERKRRGHSWKVCFVVWKLNTVRIAQFPRTWSTMVKHWGTRDRGRVIFT